MEYNNYIKLKLRIKKKLNGLRRNILTRREQGKEDAYLRVLSMLHSFKITNEPFEFEILKNKIKRKLEFTNVSYGRSSDKMKEGQKEGYLEILSIINFLEGESK